MTWSCPLCGYYISDWEDVCKNCGYDDSELGEKRKKKLGEENEK